MAALLKIDVKSAKQQQEIVEKYILEHCAKVIRPSIASNDPVKVLSLWR